METHILYMPGTGNTVEFRERGNGLMDIHTKVLHRDEVRTLPIEKARAEYARMLKNGWKPKA